uniref:leucine--tRNA ligase n=2 Tax=Hirondellea gigas TaxID=1518452 RepID=A0A2P2I6A3_9CRUS
MKHLLSCVKYTCQTYQLVSKVKYPASQCTRSIFSKSLKWDEEFPTPAVLQEVEAHWRGVFEKQYKQRHDGISSTSTKKKKYILAMFPYPSGLLHMGHIRVYTMSDTMARYYTAQGYQVIHPIGWDSFGLPAENAAREHGISPAAWTKQNISNMKEQFKELGCSFDWWREVSTCEPQYYRWTQELFLRMYRAGLAYKKEAFVNWDPVDETVLANEQVDQQGRAWRSGAVVEQKLLNQWYIRSTRFSKSLQDGLDSPQLQDWKYIVPLQKNWIGECNGFIVNMNLTFSQEESTATSNPTSDHLNLSKNSNDCISVFTKHPELLYAVSFIAVRSDHFLVKSGYREHQQTQESSLQNSKQELQAKYKILKAAVRNPLSEKPIPIIVADDLPYDKDVAEYYVGYGGGSKLNKEICDAWGIDTVQVLESGNLMDYLGEHDNTAEGDGEVENNPDCKSSENSADVRIPEEVLINSGALSGLSAVEARTAALSTLQQSGAGGYAASSNLRDWLISRQRYWGTPIPMIECPSCGTVPVPSEQLPVLLPDMTDTGSGGDGSDTNSHILAGLQHCHEWRKCSCPKCGGPAERETDTIDTFVDSSWYFLRFLDPDNEKEAFSREAADAAMPVDLYIGGVEHAVLHLYFARFLQHFLHSEGLTQHTEPFTRLLLMGRIKAAAYIRRSDGKYLPRDAVDFSVKPPVDKETRSPVQTVNEKMSKSKHNGVDPRVVVQQYSTDAMRLAVVRGESPVTNRNWRDDSVVPVMKMINLVWRTVGRFIYEREKDSLKENEDNESVRSGVISEACLNLRKVRNNAVFYITYNMDNLLPNASIRQLETFVHQIRSVPLSAMREPEFEKSLAALLVMLAPIIPHMSAELWLAFSTYANTKHFQEGTVQEQPWPQRDAGFQPTVIFTCSVNDEYVFKTELSYDEFTSFNEQKMIGDLILREAKVRDSIAGQPILKSAVDMNHLGTTMSLSLYTLDEEALKKKKKSDKAKRKEKNKAAAKK